MCYNNSTTLAGHHAKVKIVGWTLRFNRPVWVEARRERITGDAGTIDGPREVLRRSRGLGIDTIDFRRKAFSGTIHKAPMIANQVKQIANHIRQMRTMARQLIEL